MRVRGRMRVQEETVVLWNKERGMAQTLRPGNGEDVLELWKCQGIWSDCMVGLGRFWSLRAQAYHMGARTAAFKQTSWPWARVPGSAVNEWRSEDLPPDLWTQLSLEVSVCPWEDGMGLCEKRGREQISDHLWWVEAEPKNTLKIRKVRHSLYSTTMEQTLFFF